MIIKYIFLSWLICSSLINIRADWVNVSNGINNLTINALTATGTYIFAGNQQYVYRSSNNGGNWQIVFNLKALALASNGNYVFMSYENGVGRSTDYGNNWSAAGLNKWTNALLVNGNYVYAGCYYPIPGGNTDRGVWISSNNGANWTHTSLNYVDVYTIAVSGSYLFAGGYNTGVAGGVFVSTNNGQNWSNPLLVGGNAIATDGNFIYTGGGSSTGIYKSTNYGTNWTQTSLNNVAIHALEVYNNIVFAGGGGLFVSTDNGITWIPRNEGWGAPYITTFCIHNNFLFAGISGQGIWRRPLSELVGIVQISSNIPNGVTLEQNYPNPFNPNTSIKYNITNNNSYVALTIFDVTGRIIHEPVKQKQNAGTYQMDFNGGSLASGVYFYRLIVNNQIINTKKMILNK